MKMITFLNIFLLIFLSSSSFAATTAWENGKTKCVPAFKNEALAGYICPEIEKGSIFDKIGLQTTDTILTINNEPMNALEDHSVIQIEAFNSCRIGSIEVDRNGNKKTLKTSEKFERSKGYPRACRDLMNHDHVKKE